MNKKATKIVEVLLPTMEKTGRYYMTKYGRKTKKVMIAMVFNIIAEGDTIVQL